MEKEIKLEIIGKSILLSILAIVISISLLFFIMVSKVNAAMVCIGYNGSTEVFNTNNNGQGNIPSYTGALTYIKCYDTNYNLEGTNKTFTYGMSINIEYQTANPWTPNINYNMNGGYIDNINSLSFHRSDKCYFNTYRQDNDTTVALLNGKNRRLYGSMTCNGVEGLSSYTPPAFIIEFTSSGSNSSRNYKGAFTGQIATIAFDESTNQEEVISEIGQQTADLVNQINSQTNAIISNANDNTQNIIDNQNENTDRLTEAIENQNKRCISYNYGKGQIVAQQNRFLGNQGQISESTSWDISDYIEISDNNYTITLSQNDGVNYCLYNKNKVLIQCGGYQNSPITINNSNINASYIRYTIPKTNSNRTFNFTGQYCYNLIEGTEDDWKEENPDKTAEENEEEAMEELGDYLTNDSDIRGLNYEIDQATNIVIWGIFDDIITQHPLILTTTITILFLGIIKLILAR